MAVTDAAVISNGVGGVLFCGRIRNDAAAECAGRD
jgi:hypothetical protein